MDHSMEGSEETCLFPILNTDFVEDDGFTRINVSLPLSSATNRFNESSRRHEAIFLLAWSIVLQAYTGSDYPSFYVSDGITANSSTFEPRAGKLCSADLSEDHDISRLLQTLKTKDLPAGGIEANYVNTALRFDSAKISSALADLSLIVSIVRGPEEWTVALSALPNVLSSEQALCLVDAFVHVVHQLSTVSRLTSVDWCAPTTLEQLDQWNLDEPEEIQECIHELILGHCRKAPSAPAICSWDGDFTYGELEDLSLQIARRLVRSGVGPDTFVGLYFDKSKWVTVAMVAVLRAGGAYLFLEPSFPKERLRKICQQSHVHIILASGQLQEQAAELHPSVFSIDKTSLQAVPSLQYNGDPDVLLDTVVQPHHAAYVSFTSGSTGDPKGAVINHSSFVSGQRPFLELVRLGPRSRVLQFASYAFDMCIWEHLAPLMVGGCICVPSETARQSNLSKAINQMSANFLTITPTVARLLRPADIPFVETLILIGEPPSSNDVTTWVGHCRLMNGYGPCECSVFTTARDFEPGDHAQPTIIGRGVGARCWVTDPTNLDRLLPVGAVGELIIEGPIVGRGYIDNAGKNNDCFIDSPPPWRCRMSPDNRFGRMYRTGDLVQYVSGGELRCLGRKDAQAKLRGQRLEMGEVENNLQKAFGDDVQTAIVDIITPHNGQAVLMGFIHLASPADTKPPTATSGRPTNMFCEPRPTFRSRAQSALSQMREKLPSYMVPASIVELASLPTTKTGKADRKSLRAEAGKLTRSHLEAFTRHEVEQQPPRSRMEHELTQLISKVLKLDGEFGVNDNFFHLGGDSVLVMELVRLAREEAGIEISAQTVFMKPVLSELALSLMPLPNNKQSDDDVPLFSLLADYLARHVVLQTAQTMCNLSSENEIEDVYPCTPTQEAMMAGSMASVSEATYVIRTVYRLPRHIDSNQLRHAWDSVVQSNAILRTRIIQSSTDQALQVVLRDGVSWEHFDNLAQAVAQDSQHKMGLGEPLLRLKMVQENNNRRFLICTIHHALCDGWSLHKTMAQVEAAYYGENPSSRPFKLFVKHILKLDQQEMHRFWKEKLNGFSGSPFPTLPPGSSDKYRPANIQTTSRCIDKVKLPVGTSTTAATLLQLSWALVLSQYGGTDDIVFGTTVSGRNTPIPGIADILGPALATVPVRIKLVRNSKVSDLLQSVHDMVAQLIPFEQIGLEGISSLGGAASAACRFQSLLIIQPPQVDEDAASSIFGKQVKKHAHEVVGSYMITLEAVLGRDGSVRLVAEHDGNLISTEFMANILGQLEHNMEQIRRNYDKSMKDLVWTTRSDVKMLHVWNRHIPEAIDICIHDVMTRRALAWPSAAAVSAWDGTLTYKDLSDSSSKLAARVQAAVACGPGTFILIHTGKSLWTAVAIMAVLKTGAAFVLVDPAQPLSRLQQICSDTRAKMVIASTQFKSQASAIGVDVLILNRDTDDNACLVNGNGPTSQSLQEPPVTPKGIAYAVFTSGSTGRPKGVLISHRAFLTSALINGGKQHINNQSRVMQLASFTFDAAIAEFLYTLVHGGCVCIPSEAESKNNLEKAMNDYGGTWATLTPSLARALDPSKVTTLHTLALGGEAMTKVDMDMWAEHVLLGNGYGPAESSVDAVIQPDVRNGSDPGNMGRSYAGATWIVDPTDHNRLLPVGAIGELLLEGPTLADGYLNDAEKTRSSFVLYPDWLMNLRYGKHGRLYKTGDLAQYDTTAMDGSIKYLGRKDNQVKIRGQRIELAEVEHHVQECIASAKVVIAEVVIPSDDGAEPLLAAFVLLESTEKAEMPMTDGYLASIDRSSWAVVREAESLLRRRVPSYMIPAIFLPLCRVPVNANGKVDRRLLKDEASIHTRKELRALTSSPLSSPKRLPKTVEELTLHGSVSALLKISISELGMDDNFFHTGGDSILAMKLVALVRNSGYSLSVADVFTHPRLTDLASCLKNIKSPGDTPPLQAFSLLREETRDDVIDTVARQCGVEVAMVEDVYASTPMQEALLASSMKDDGSYKAEIYLDLCRDTDVGLLKDAWAAVYEANAILRTRLVLGPSEEVLQVVVRENLAWCSRDDQLFVTLGRPLVKLYLDLEHRAVRLQIHHALYDASSLSHLFDQVVAAYRGDALRPSQFSRFAAFTSNLDVGACRKFWKDEFSKADTITFFPPQQRPKPTHHLTKRHMLSRTFALEGASKSDFTLPTMIYLAAGLVFGHYMQSDDVVYGLTLAGRNTDISDTGNIVGPTVTTIPFRVQLNTARSVSGNLANVQDRLLRVGPYEQTGLKNISSASSSAAKACNFKCHIVVQPADEALESAQDVPFTERETSEDQYIAFASYPLVLVYSLSRDRKTYRVTVNTDTLYLREEDVINLLDQLNHTLQQIIQSQDASLGSIEVISPRDMTQLARHNSTVPAPVDKLIHELVFENSTSHPQKPAISSWDGFLTYAELCHRSTQLSKYLFSTAVGQQNTTVVCMEKSRWTIVAILAVLQIGSACAVVDSSHPPERIREIVSQTKCNQVVVSPSTRHIPSLDTTLITVSEDLFDSLDASSTTLTNDVKQVRPTDPALIFFTSGSTGKPKGMILDHRAIATSLHHLRPLFDINEDLRVLHFVSYAFDIAMLEILQALTTGGCLCIPSDTDRTSGLVDFIRDERVNFAALATSGARLLEHAGQVPTLKMLMLGGEPLTLNDVARWSGSLRLIHGYAPAECSFVCAGSHLKSADQWIPGTIGPALTGCCWVTDPSDPEKLVAWGAVGELLVEGHILAREYIGNRDITEASFIRNPPWLARFRKDASKETRLYRTGDLARYTSEGEIRFVGRKDSQVKLRGQRIELGEVESHVQSNLPLGCTVIAGIVSPQSTDCDQKLYVFIYMGEKKSSNDSSHENQNVFLRVSEDKPFVDLCGEVASRLSQLLPRYMLPDEYVRLNYIPETGSGKIDRRILVNLASDTPVVGVNASTAKSATQVLPRTKMEKILAAVWSEELRLPISRLTLSDNFFQLGGDSIHAMKLATASRKQGLQLSVPDIFSSPSLGDMALLASKQAGGELPQADVEPFSLLHEQDVSGLKRAAAEQCGVDLTSIEDIYPCTPFQEGLVSQSLRKDAGAFVGSFRFQLPATVDLQQFYDAWQRTAEMSSILRTRIIQHEASLVQVVIREDIPWKVVHELEDRIDSLEHESFRFGHGLLQLILFQKHVGSYEFLMRIHHSIYDGWSINLLLDQVAFNYQATQVSRPPFHRFVHHICRNHESAKAYWQKHLSGATGNVFPRLPSSIYEPVTNSVINCTVGLKSQQGVTPATILQLAWATVLCQLTDSADVVYGMILSGRTANLEGIESITGPTVTTIPMRVNVQRDQPVQAELHRLQKQVNEMTSYQQFGLRNIKAIGGDPEAACAFQSLLLIQPAASTSSEMPNNYLWTDPVEQPRNAGDFSTYALEVTCEVSNDTVDVTFDFDDTVLEASQARRLLHQYCHAINEIQQHKEAFISQLDLFDENSQNEIFQWNSVLPEAVDKCIHDGIIEKCQNTPDAVAVCAWDGDFTYKDLDELSFTLAVYLQGLGVGPEVFVPVLAEKSRWVAIAILGVVRAGGAIILLDPSVPLERLRIVCQTVSASLIVTGNDTCTEIAQHLVPVVVDVGHRESQVYHMNGVADIRSDAGPSNALYAIFTSGSTGKPKGIVTEHRAFYTSGLAQQRPLRINEQTRTLQFASHMFDVSVADYLWTFLAGGCVCVPSQDMLKDDLKGAINQLKVNRADLTPSVARVLKHSDIPTVKVILLGGEPMSQHDIDTWAGKVELVNGYGPSECSVCCILADVDSKSSPSTIGNAYGIVPWVVDKDDHDHLMPIGGIGELILEGHALARGYVGDAGKAAASAFIVEMPRWLQKLRSHRSRLYKTGDLVQYNPDGTIKYIGRKDTQIKIRGQRVELEEIEQQTRQSNTSFRHVVVEPLVIGDQLTDKMLAAFIYGEEHTESSATPNSNTQSSSLFYGSSSTYRDTFHSVASKLRQTLPRYMIPAVFIPLKFLPLTPTGKADRRQLRKEASSLSPAILREYQAASTEKRSPQTQGEHDLQIVVAEVLQLTLVDIGMDDDFFQLGGDSIIALHLVQRARQSGFSFRVTTVFKTPKLSDLALHLTETRNGHKEQEAFPHPFQGFNLPGKQELVGIMSTWPLCSDHKVIDVLPVTQSTERYLHVAPEYWIMNVKGPIDPGRLQSACDSLVERHGVLRSVFSKHIDRYIQIVLDKVPTGIMRHKTSAMAIFDYVEHHRTRDTVPIPSLNIPITQFLLLEDVSGHQALVLRLSHAQFDGCSLHTLWHDLKYLYEGASLPAATNYKLHMKQWARSQTREAFEYWRRILDGSDISKINNSTFDGESFHRPHGDRGSFVSVTRCVPLPAACPEGITLATVIKASWACTLAQLTGRHDVVFSQAVNGRSTDTISKDVVGLCLNFSPVRVKLQSDVTAFDLLKLVQKQHRLSLEYELLDFRKIAQESTLWPEGAIHQSMLVHQNIDPDLPFKFGEAQAHVTCSYHWEHPPDDILIESRPLKVGNSLQLTLDTTTGTLVKANADMVLGKLCNWVVALLSKPEDRLEKQLFWFEELKHVDA